MLKIVKGKRVASGLEAGGAPVDWESFILPGPPADPALAVITCFYNPCGYVRPVENWTLFSRYMAAQGLPLFTIELGSGGKFYLPEGERMTRVESAAVLWHKEKLLNVLAGKLPTEFRYVAAIDCDHFFGAQDWHRQAVKLLESGKEAVQLFREHAYANRDDVVTKRRTAYAAGLKRGDPPGGAWIYRREFWAEVGLYDRLITGGGDVIAAYACAGDLVADYFAKQGRAGDHCIDWMCRCHAFVRRRVGHVDTLAYHRWHGEHADRQYTSRIALLADFEPETDLRENADGVWEWATDKPLLHEGFRRYFRDRREDGQIAPVNQITGVE